MDVVQPLRSPSADRIPRDLADATQLLMLLPQAAWTVETRPPSAARAAHDCRDGGRHGVQQALPRDAGASRRAGMEVA